MGREIKFRVWDKRNKEIVDLTGYKIVSKNNVQLFYYDEDGDRATCTTLLENIELIQYTGLKDCGGREIYEGDIVKQRLTREGIIPEQFILYEIIFINGMFTRKDLSDSYIDCMGLNRKSETIEVIGNIYKNPELLEVAE